MWFEVGSVFCPQTGGCIPFRFYPVPWSNYFKAVFPSGAWLQVNMSTQDNVSLAFLTYPHSKRQRRFYQRIWNCLGTKLSSLNRELSQIIRQRTAPPRCPEQLDLYEQTLVVYNSAPFQNVLCWDGLFLRKAPLENSHFGWSFFYTLSSHCTSSWCIILHGINTGLPLRGRQKIQLFLRKSIWLSVYSKSWSYSLRGFHRLTQSEN